MHIVALDLIFFFSFLFYMDCCADWHVILVDRLSSAEQNTEHRDAAEGTKILFFAIKVSIEITYQFYLPFSAPGNEPRALHVLTSVLPLSCIPSDTFYLNEMRGTASSMAVWLPSDGCSGNPGFLPFT